MQAAYASTELASQMPKMLENCSTVWYPFATHKGLETQVGGWLQSLRERVRYGTLCPTQQRDLCEPLERTMQAGGATDASS